MALPGRPWKPGSTPYKDYLEGLTPEELEAHKQKRAARKSMRKAMETVIRHNQEIWLSELNNTAAELLRKAKENGDVQAFIAVYDRVVAPRNKDTIQVEFDKPLPWDDNLD